jgi:simple sugar transport system permease protein
MMASNSAASAPKRGRVAAFILRPSITMPLLSIVAALLAGALVIFITSGSLETVVAAYDGLLRGALFKERGLSESLVATVPYIMLSLALAVGFKSGLFNIGVEGQFTVGAISAAWMGQALEGAPAILHLPLALGAGALGGALWAAIPGFLKARTGAHEVITTIMMNYVAFRLVEFLVSGPLKDPVAAAIQTPRVSPGAELWSLSAIPARLQDPMNALFVALIVAGLVYLVLRAARVTRRAARPARLAISMAAGALAFAVLPPLTQAWWPFQDPYDRLHIGLFLAVFAAVAVWWLLWKTTWGFELRMVGANPNAARYAGVSITRNIMVAMILSGGLAGLAGTMEVLGVSICRCLPLFFSSGYGFDSIAITLLAKNDPFGIVLSSFLFGAMRNGSDLMELNSGVSKYIISLLQALLLLFVAAPPIVRWLFRLRGAGKADEATPLTRGWGGQS